MPLNSGAGTVKYERHAEGKKNLSSEEEFCSVKSLCRKRENIWDK